MGPDLLLGAFSFRNTWSFFFFFFLQIFLSALTQPVQGQGEALTVPRVSGQGPALSKVHSANSH